MNKSKLFMIISICVLCFSIVGATVAYYVQELFSIEANTITYGLDYYINYEKGQNITGTLEPTTDYTTSANATIKFWKDNTSPYEIYGHIYLDLTTLSEKMSNLKVLKYSLVNNDNVVSSGIIKQNGENTVLLKANIPLSTEEELYTVYVWLDESKVDATISSEKLELTVRCEATMKPISVNSINYITNLYQSSNPTLITQESSGDKYYYAGSAGLMNDGRDSTGEATNDMYEGNIRYYGANPNNFIDIGDRDSSGKVIPWRIIGVFENMKLGNGTNTSLIKIIRATGIGYYSYDNKSSGIGTSTNKSGSNNWSDARLMMLLNPGYEKGFTASDGDLIYGYEGSLYWNSSGSSSNPQKCYLDDNDAVVDCYFDSKGLSTNSKQYIETVIWNVGGIPRDVTGWNINDYYKAERGNARFNENRDLTWEGKIALMYPSDYGYATDLTKCNYELPSYNTDTINCAGTNWLTIPSGNATLLTPESTSVQTVKYVSSKGQLVAYSAASKTFVCPTAYLKSTVKIIGGDGSSGNPYKISL